MGRVRSPSRPTAAPSPPGTSANRSASGTCGRASRLERSRPPARPTPWHSRPTARRWRPSGVTRACRSGRLLREFGTGATVHGLAFLPDGKTVVAATSGEKLLFWDVNDDEPVEERELPRWPDSMAVSPDGRMLAIRYSTGGRVSETRY